MSTSTEVRKDQENPLLNLLFNIVLPVVILNQLAKRLDENGPLIALIVAVALPVGYGVYDFFSRKKTNYISVLGVVNIAFTGGFALLELDGQWFALKEAFFPLIIGLAVHISNIMGRPFLKTLFWNPAVFKINKIEDIVMHNNQKTQFDTMFIRASHLFSFTFMLSAALNFLLARRIFVPIDVTFSKTQKSDILNQQIAEMTWQGYVVIALPMMFFMGFILWYLLKNIKQLTGLNFDDIIVQEKTYSSSK